MTHAPSGARYSRPAPFGDFYRGRSVLVTGNAGFKGSWLCRWLVLLGADVHGLRPPAVGFEDGVRLAGGRGAAAVDIRDGDAVQRAVGKAEPEVVFHLAAQSNLLRSYRQPAETFDINVMGTVRLLEACSSVGSVRAVVVITSDKCYAEGGTGPHTESDPLGGADPYSASKAAAEFVVGAWRTTGTAPLLATARAGNVIGGGDWSDDRIVADMARAARAGVPAELRHPAAVRPWQHVLEPLAGYLQLGARLAVDGTPFDRAWNFGPDPGTARAVAELATEFADRWSAHAGRAACPPRIVATPGPPERARLTLDSSAAAARLGWCNVLSFAEAVDLAAEWYARSATDPAFDAAAVTDEQIARYQARATQGAAALVSA